MDNFIKIVHNNHIVGIYDAFDEFVDNYDNYLLNLVVGLPEFISYNDLLKILSNCLISFDKFSKQLDTVGFKEDKIYGNISYHEMYSKFIPILEKIINYRLFCRNNNINPSFEFIHGVRYDD